MLAYDNHGVLPAVDDGWWMEPKIDGVRWQVERIPGGVRSWIGRNGNEKTGVHPEIEDALLQILPVATVLDGELYDTPNGKRLAVFDVMWMNGDSLLYKPLEDRRAYLEALVPGRAMGDLVHTLPHVEVRESVHKAWMSMGMEGSVVKRKRGLYVPGKRSRDWLKVKPQSTAEAIVVGYKMGEGASNTHRIGALKIKLIDNDAETTVGYDADPAEFPALQGRVLEFAHHRINPSGKPRHPVFKRWREDRDV
jgi:bifunctional non-homologous end joining protein LigD